MNFYCLPNLLWVHSEIFMGKESTDSDYSLPWNKWKLIAGFFTESIGRFTNDLDEAFCGSLDQDVIAEFVVADASDWGKLLA